MFVLPEWRYKLAEKLGVDMSNFVQAPQYAPPEKERVVVYLNREARRKSARARKRAM